MSTADQSAAAAASDASDKAASSLTFYQILGLAIIGIIIVVILVFVAINGVQTTANFIIAVATTGSQAISGIAQSIASQAQLLANSAGGTIASAAGAAASAIINGSIGALNALVAVRDAILHVVLFGFQTVVEVLSDLGQQLVQLFLASVGSALIAVQTGLVGVVALTAIVNQFFEALKSPINLLYNFLKQPFASP
jgi:hypothetical protein